MDKKTRLFITPYKSNSSMDFKQWSNPYLTFFDGIYCRVTRDATLTGLADLVLFDLVELSPQ